METAVAGINLKFARLKPDYDLRYFPANDRNKQQLWQFAKKLSFTDIKYVYLSVYTEADAVKEVKRILGE